MGGIRSAVYGLEQTLRQLSTQLDRWTTDPRVGLDGGGDPSYTCADACKQLRHCATSLYAVTARLETAHELTSHLTFDTSRPAPPRAARPAVVSKAASSPPADGPIGRIEETGHGTRSRPGSPPTVAKAFDSPSRPDHRGATAGPEAHRVPGRIDPPDPAAEQQHRARRTSR